MIPEVPKSRSRNFYEILYFSVFRKSVQIIQVLLKSGKNNGYFTQRRKYIYLIISRSVLLIRRNVADKNNEKIKINI